MAMELLKASICDFEEIYREMQKSFIPDELRDKDAARQTFENESYSVYLALENGEQVGFITTWHFPDFEFAEHFVVYEKLRNRGFGKKILEKLTEKFPRVVLEVEHPTTEIAARRLAFYKRYGFCENPQPYTQPAYSPTSSEVPLIIMSYPQELQNFDDTIAEIKRIVYNFPQSTT